jgi:cytochrome d ubiquinol oxidase subunit I
MTVAAYLATALVVGAAGAWHLLRGRDDKAIRTMTSMAMWMLLLVAPVQILIGDLHGLNTLVHQPAKLAAIEGHWENRPGQGVPLTLIGWPDMERELNHFAIEVPHLGSLLLTHSWDGQFRGLKSFPRSDRPNATVVFWSFRVMVGLGLLMLALGVWSLWARWRGTLYRSRPLLRSAVVMAPAGLIAILAGWMTTEAGRQPWVVYDVMRTADAVSPHDAGQLGISLVLFVVVYFVLFGAGTLYVLRILARGPAEQAADGQPRGGPGQRRQPGRPMSAAPDRFDTAPSAPGSERTP